MWSYKGGTALGSLFSNKNLWSGEQSGRGTCRTCAQPEEKKEPCTLRNIVYESECTKCNPPGSRKEAEKNGLEERREKASLYVGKIKELKRSIVGMQRLERKRATCRNTRLNHMGESNPQHSC